MTFTTQQMRFWSPEVRELEPYVPGEQPKIQNLLKLMPIELVAAAKSLQSCPTLCDPIDGSPPGFPIPGILQARKLEWVAISFSNA